MNQSDKHPQSLFDALITEIIAEFSLEEIIRLVNLNENEIMVLEAVLAKLLNYRLEKLDEKVNEELLNECISRSGDKSLDHADAAVFILEELWKRLQETHRLRMLN